MICSGLVAELTQQASFPADEFERERRQLIEGLKIERTTPGLLGKLSASAISCLERIRMGRLLRRKRREHA